MRQCVFLVMRAVAWGLPRVLGRVCARAVVRACLRACVHVRAHVRLLCVLLFFEAQLDVCHVPGGFACARACVVFRPMALVAHMRALLQRRHRHQRALVLACRPPALFRARGLALADHTEALVGSVSRDRVPSGHIPLILLVFVQGLL